MNLLCFISPKCYKLCPPVSIRGTSAEVHHFNWEYVTDNDYNECRKKSSEFEFHWRYSIVVTYPVAFIRET